MDPATIFKIITNSTWIVTQLMGGESVRFSQENYLVEVVETTPPGTLLVLQATTPDADSPLQYHLSEDSNRSLFRIDAATGTLYLVSSLDYETQKEHEVRVMAYSTGGRVGSSEAAVRVRVTDANDHAPRFAKDRHETQITEENAHGLPRAVYTVTAEDGDKGIWGVLRYALSGDGAFQPTSSNDTLYLHHKNADHGDGVKESAADTEGSHSHSVHYSEQRRHGGHRSWHTSLTQNQNKMNTIPLLVDPGGIAAEGGHWNGKLNYDLNGEVSLNEMNSDSRRDLPAFSVNPKTGTISVMKPLDRDPPHGSALWRLVVTASDGELQADTTVILNLKDINDNAPVFPSSRVEAAVTENAPNGTSVVTITAEDYDDKDEGSNAKIVYSLQKNAIDETTGRAIFSVDSNTGSIKTAMCCLDREHASQYSLTLVATDGGGLQGSCEVEVIVADENDVPPRWGRAEWTVELEEEKPLEHVLATLTVKDPDTHNSLAFRVVPESGRGWQMVQVAGRSAGDGAELKALETLDFENPHHRPGLRFQVQVTDQGTGGWGNKYRVGVATVTVRILDINDNTPVFAVERRNVSVSEDAALGTVVAALPASDEDGSLNGLVSYGIVPSSDPNHHFGVDPGGTVRIVRRLDREAAARHTIVLGAWDHGQPQRESSATVVVDVTDVNDNAPQFSNPTYLKVHQNNLSDFVSHFSLTDSDDWSLGHGPPFKAYLDPLAPSNVADAVKVTYSSDAGGGRGTVRVVGQLVRDVHTSTIVPVVTVDSGNPPMTATVSLTIAVVGDDSPTTTRDISVFTVKSTVENGLWVPLGFLSPQRDENIFKAEYSWSRQHQYFELNRTTGQLYLDADAPSGSYNLGLAIRNPPGADVQVNVRVAVSQVFRHTALHATPVDIASSSAQLLDTRQTGSSLISTLEHALSVLSIQARERRPLNISGFTEEVIHPNVKVVSLEEITDANGDKMSRAWLIADAKPPLELFFSYNKFEIEDHIGLSVLGAGPSRSSPSGCGRVCECCCSPNIFLDGGYSVTHAPTATLVGPALRLESNCKCINNSMNSNHHHQEDQVGHEKLDDDVRQDTSLDVLNRRHILRNREKTDNLPGSTERDGAPFAHAMTNQHLNGKLVECNENTCLNGGRCLPSSPGYKCVCPAGTSGPRCKILTRHFIGDNGSGFGSWAWLSPLNPCSKLQLSLSLLTGSQNITVFSTLEARGDNKAGMTLTLKEGKPEFVISLKTGTASVRIDVPLSDLRWHRLDITWRNKTVEMVVDNCVENTESDFAPGNGTSIANDKVKCRSLATSPYLIGQLDTRGAPLELGNTVRADDDKDDLADTLGEFNGCLKNLRINGELNPQLFSCIEGRCVAPTQQYCNKDLQDLGNSLLSHRSAPGCMMQSCQHLNCPANAVCLGSPRTERCECKPGWTGEDCQSRTVPTSFAANSFLQVALLFTPPARFTSIQLRVRTRQSNSLVLAVRSLSGTEHLVLNLRSGRPCLTLQHQHARQASVCLSVIMNDGMWHNLMAYRYGNQLELLMDDGDDELQKMSQNDQPEWHTPRNILHIEDDAPPSKSARSLPERPVIHTNFKDGCLDDVRVCGKVIPMPPTSNTTAFGVLEASLHLEAGCWAPPACENATCPHPFVCSDTWKQFKCDCGDGFKLSADGSSCHDVDECVYEPCLYSGTCYNSLPGYRCSCAASFSGRHCERQISQLSYSAMQLPLLLAGVVTGTILLGLLFSILTYYIITRRRRRPSTKSASKDDERINFYMSKTPKASSDDNLLSVYGQKLTSMQSTCPSVGGVMSPESLTTGSAEALHLMEVHYTARSSTHTSLAPSLYDREFTPTGLGNTWKSNPSITGVDVLSSVPPLRAPRGYRDEEDTRSAASGSVTSKTENLATDTPQASWPLLKTCCSDVARERHVINRPTREPKSLDTCAKVRGTPSQLNGEHVARKPTNKCDHLNLPPSESDVMGHSTGTIEIFPSQSTRTSDDCSCTAAECNATSQTERVFNTAGRRVAKPNFPAKHTSSLDTRRSCIVSSLSEDISNPKIITKSRSSTSTSSLSMVPGTNINDGSISNVPELLR